jgi:Zn-finger nucleic acid-binding protein
MERVVYEGVEVDRCTQCQGLWFDCREDDKLRSRRAARALDVGNPATGRQYDQMRAVQCPRCTTRMVRVTDPQHVKLHYESCPVCFGAFFDAGEFREHTSAGPLLERLRRLLVWEPRR